MSKLDLDQADFTFTCEALKGADLRVYQFRGHEQISQPSEFLIDLVCDNLNVDLQTPIGQPATLTLRGRQLDGTRYSRYVHGIIERLVQLKAGRRQSHYQVTIVPTLKPMAYTRSSRIFQRQNIPDITQKVLHQDKVLSDWIDPILHGSYAPRDYCVQYQESDLTFVQRLWEEDGIFYFFEHGKDKDKLVLGDGSFAFSMLTNYDAVRLRDQPHLYEEGLFEFRAESSLRSGATVLRDFKFKQPALDMEATAQSDTFADYKMYFFPGEYVDPAIGQQLAKVRLEELQWPKNRYVGAGNVRAMLPGHKFTLSGHRRNGCNQEYLILSVEHRGSQPQALGEESGGLREPSYQNWVECIPATVSYRPPRVTAMPSITGVQTALVVGPPGEEIHCDEHGRIKVQFHWDREGKKDDNSSCWIRVSQPWGGAGQGGMFIPRVGQEVVVQFLEGDPDRPLVVGRVYNGENPVPHGLPAAKNISTIRSSSTPGGGGFNEIKFNDTKGSEELFIHAQYDRNEIVGHNHDTKVAVNQQLNVGVDQTNSIGANQSTSVTANLTLQVGGNQSISVTGNRDVSVTGNEDIVVEGNRTESVIGNDTVTVQGNRTMSVLGDQTETIAGSETQSIAGNKTVNLTGAHTKNIAGAHTSNVVGDHNENVAANRSITVDGTQTHTVAGAVSLDCAATVTCHATGDMTQVTDANATLSATGMMSLSAVGQAMLVSAAELDIGAPTINVAGSTIIITAGGASIKISGSGVEINGPTIKVGGGSVDITGGIVKINSGDAMDPITKAAAAFTEDCARYWRQGGGPLLRMVANAAERVEILKLLRAQEWNLQNRTPLFLYDLPFESGDAYCRDVAEKIKADYTAVREGLERDGISLAKLDQRELRTESPMVTEADKLSRLISQVAELLRRQLDGALLALLPRQVADPAGWRESVQLLLRGITSKHVRLAVFDIPDGPLSRVCEGQGDVHFTVDEDQLIDYFKQAGSPVSAGPLAPSGPQATPEQQWQLEAQLGRKLMSQEQGAQLRNYLLDAAQKNSKAQHLVALRLYQSALELCRHGGFLQEEAMVLMAIAGSYLAIADPEQAVHCYHRAAELARSEKLWPLACQASLGVGAVLLSGQRYVAAAEAYEQAAAAARQGAAAVLELEALRMAGTCHLLSHNSRAATRCWQYAVDLGAELPAAERQHSTLPQTATAFAALLEKHGLREQAAHVRAMSVSESSPAQTVN